MNEFKTTLHSEKVINIFNGLIDVIQRIRKKKVNTNVKKYQACFRKSFVLIRILTSSSKDNIRPELAVICENASRFNISFITGSPH